jgi:hypothetical protein
MPSVTTSAVLGAAADRVWALLRDFSAIGLPVRDYVASLRVTPLGDEQSLVTWSARYDCDAVDEAGVLAQVRDGVFRPGLAAPVHRFHHAPTGVTR